MGDVWWSDKGWVGYMVGRYSAPVEWYLCVMFGTPPKDMMALGRRLSTRTLQEYEV